MTYWLLDLQNLYDTHPIIALIILSISALLHHSMPDCSFHLGRLRKRSDSESGWNCSRAEERGDEGGETKDQHQAGQRDAFGDENDFKDFDADEDGVLFYEEWEKQVEE